MSSLYTLDINPLTDTCFANFFLTFCRLSFNFLNCFFCCTESFKFGVAHLLIFAFVFCCLIQCHIKKIIAKTNVNGSPIFSSRSFIASFPILVFNPFRVNFCEWCNTRAQFYCSAYVYPVFTTPSVEETILSLLGILGSIVKYQLTIYVNFNYGFCILFHWFMCLFLCQCHTVSIMTAL